MTPLTIMLTIVLAIQAASPAPLNDQQLQTSREEVARLLESGSPLNEIENAIRLRRAEEDRLLEENPGIELWLAGAAEPFLTDLRASRAGSSSSWGVPPAAERRFAEDARNRSESMANAAWTATMDEESRSNRTARATAAGLRAAAMIGRERGKAMNDDWTERLGQARQLINEAIDLSGRPRGPLLEAAAISAAAAGDNTRARSLITRARQEPAGIDPLTLDLIEASINAGGLDAESRIRGARAISLRKITPSERLFVTEWILRAAHEAHLPRNEPPDIIFKLINATESSRRPSVLRAVAEIFTRLPGESTDHPLDSFGTARRLITSGRSDEAIPLLNAVAAGEMASLRSEASLELANLHLAAGDASAARISLMNAIQSGPTHPSTNQAARLALKLARRSGGAEEVLSKVISILPNHPDRYAWRLQLGDFAAARLDQTRALELWRDIPTIAPESIAARSHLAEILLDSSQFKRRNDPGELMRVIDELEQSVNRHGDAVAKSRAKVLRMRALLQEDRRQEAAQLAESMLDLSMIPESERLDTMSVVIAALRSANKDALAGETLAALATIDPASHQLFVRRMLDDEASRLRLLLQEGRRSKAEEEARELLTEKLTPDDKLLRKSVENDPWLVVETAFIMRLAGQPEAAARVADIGLSAYPTATEILLEKADALAMLPDRSSREEAIKLFRRIRAGVERGTNPWWRAEIGQLELMAELSADLTSIGHRIEQLRNQNAQFGGRLFRTRFESLQAKLDAARIEP